jgi:hypothetical protein
MFAFEQRQMTTSESPSRVNAVDQVTENDFKEELYKPKFEFFLREGVPAIREFSKLLDLFNINRNTLVLENVEALYDELLKKVAGYGAYYEETRKALEEQRGAFLTLVEDLTIYRELVKTTKKEIKFFPLLQNYDNWIRSVVAEKPEEQQDTAEGKEKSLSKKLANTYAEYIEQVYGADDFSKLTNLALKQEAALFMTPSRDLRNKRIDARFQQASKEPTQIREASELSLPQYAIFQKYQKYFRGEKQTLPHLVPNENFYKLKYPEQVRIIEEIEARELFVKEDLSRIHFPETATDRMLPRDPLARIHPALRVMADKDSKKIKEVLHNAVEAKIPEGQTKTLTQIAEENTQEQLGLYLGAIDENPLGQDLLNSKDLAQALTFYRAKYGKVLFTDKDIVDRLNLQRRHEFEKKFEPYLKSFIAETLEELKNKDTNSTPASISATIKIKLKQDLQEIFHNCVPLHDFLSPVVKKISLSLEQELLNLTYDIQTGIANRREANSKKMQYSELLSILNKLANTHD